MEDAVGAPAVRGRPVTVGPDTPVREAMQIMLGATSGGAVVGAGGDLLGIFSDARLLTKVAGLHEPYAELPVRQFMTPNPRR